MQKIALCDDNEAECAAIAAMLQKYAGKRSGVRTSVFTSSRELLLSDDGADFDLYLLDVVMPEMSGIDLGLKLREQKAWGAVVYLSVTPEFAVNSYEVRAFHYLLKPVVPERLFEVLDQALAETERRKAGRVAVQTREGRRLVRMDEIKYVELAGHNARYHLNGGEVLESVTLRQSFRSQLEPLLRRKEFILCGASFAVNLRYVVGAERASFAMQGGARIPLPRRQAAQIQQQWSDYWLDGGEERP